ncbi:MAG: hypothetical protein K2M10_10465 [Muribaculaceae bacterium]|nr:hypothetical protein [Muribaculaceae bacterium]
MGHKDMPAPMAMAFLVFLSMFFVDALVVYLDYFYFEMGSELLKILLGSIYIMNIIIGYFVFIYHEKYKVIISDKRYDTVLQGVWSVIYFLLSIGSLFFSFYLIGMFDNL